jgi:hypothetical protein
MTCILKGKITERELKIYNALAVTEALVIEK